MFCAIHWFSGFQKPKNREGWFFEGSGHKTLGEDVGSAFLTDKGIPGFEGTLSSWWYGDLNPNPIPE